MRLEFPVALWIRYCKYFFYCRQLEILDKAYLFKCITELTRKQIHANQNQSGSRNAGKWRFALRISATPWKWKIGHHSVEFDSLWTHGLYSPPGFSVYGILQARILEWVAVPFSRGSSQPKDRTQVSHIAGRFFTVWASREAQECKSGQPIASPADLPDPGIEQGSPALQVDSYQLSYQGSPAIP